MQTIACFTESLGGGGAEHQMVVLAGFLAEKGYDVSLVTYADIPDHYDLPDGVKRKKISVTHVKGKRIKAILTLLKVFHFFIWVKTDCIIAYRQCANLRVLPPLFFRRRIKVICSDRNTSSVLSFRHKLLLNLLYKRADHIVPNSQTQTNFIAKHKPSLLPKLKTIHNYTDLNQFALSEMPTDTLIMKIVIFSRYSNQKNPLGFANAMKKLKAKSYHRFEVHWYGAQNGEYNGCNLEYLAVKKQIEELEINDVLILHPAVKNPATLMGNYHAVCLPSLYEGFSNSIAEGICCGKPMLVSDVSDNSLMVHDGENGFLFDPLDTDSICDAFLNLFDLSYEKLYLMARKSRAIAEKLFDKESFIQQYVGLIEE